MNNTPPEVIEKWRAEFIEWMERKHLVKITFDGDSIVVTPINGIRQGRSVPLVAGVAWEAWKEARQSVRIELPEQSWSFEGPLNDMRNSTIEHCREVIEDQGYRVNN